MKYNKTNWLDHVKDIDTGEVIQQGTPISARNLNNMEDGIATNSTLARNNKSDIVSLAVEVSILKDAALSNMTNNVFFENFTNLDSVIVSRGIYDTEQKKLYV